MKFKKEDVGLYFALGLVGAGMGLLVGAFIASRRGGPTVVNNYIPRGEVPDEEWNEEEKEHAVKIARNFSRKKKSRKKAQIITSEELAVFIAEYEPTIIQIEMVKSGILTLDELERTLILEKAANEIEPYNYNEPYLEDKPELSDLAKLPEDEDVVDDRYKILTSPPKRKSPKNMRVVYFDQENAGFYTMTRQKQPVPLGSINEFISEETWEVMLPYMLSGFAPLFVSDLTNAKYYRFELVSEDEEEFLDDEDGIQQEI